MQLAKKNAIFMHCLPAHRGEEVSNKVIDSHQSFVWEQANNRMYVQQAILSYIFNKKIINDINYEKFKGNFRLLGKS